MRIAVAGGTGLTGALVVDIARDRGHEVMVLARATGVELLSGAGLPEAMRGADAVIDTTNVRTARPDVSVSFFAGATRNLLKAGVANRVRHHVALSIVGMEAAPDGYYAGKLSQERMIDAGAVPWTILRATQFHEFAAMMFHTARTGAVHVAPRGRVTPIAAREVAERLVTLAEGEPIGRAPDLAGPQEESLSAMVRSYAKAIGVRGWIPEVSLPGTFGRALRSGALLAGSDAQRGTQTFAQWLDALPDD